jgi:glycosyltransferase involved in cell wall biosynthesis
VESVESVLSAVAAGDEVIVVDDGSTDDTAKVLSAYKSSIRYVRVPNGGVGAARNLGIREAKNDLMAFNDSDDLWLPDHLKLQRQVMERRPEVMFCFSNFGGLLSNGSRAGNGLGSWLAEFGGNISPAWSESLGHGFFFSELGVLPSNRAAFRVHIGNLYATQLRFNHVAAFTVLARRSVAGEVLEFPEDIFWGEDWECFARRARMGPVAFLDCETALQRVHFGERLTAIDRAAKAAIQLTILRRVWGNDVEFRNQNPGLYEAAIRNAHLVRARALLVQGKTAEAKEELRHAGGGPASYRALARLPGGVARALLWVRRNFTRARSVLKRKSSSLAKISMRAGDGAKTSAKAARKVVAL